MSNMLIVEDAKTKEKIRCHLRGRFKLQGLKPIVGDIVEYVRVQDAGVVESVLKRKNELLKPRVANIDQVVCVYTIKKPEVSLLILDKLLVLIEEAKLNVLLILNKIDLLTEEDKEKKTTLLKPTAKYTPFCVPALKLVKVWKN